MLLFLLLLLLGPALLAGLLRRSDHAVWLDPSTAAKLGVTLLFLATGTTHFVATAAMAEMLPTFVPGRVALVRLTGALQLMGAATLWVPRLAPLAGTLLIGMLIGMLPANVYAAFARVPFGGHELGPLYLLVRVPFQLLVIVWVYRAVFGRGRSDPTAASRRSAPAVALSRGVEPIPHVVILGGGFAGIQAAKALRSAPVRVTLVDRQNHHLFQPLLYQVATASLSPAEIARPIRDILRDQENVEVWMGEVVSVDPERRRVHLTDGDLGFDYLVVATGATHGYFSHPEWARIAPGLKTIDDALELRRRFLLAFEAAEREADPATRRRLLTFVIVGGGPTGVELAGAMAEIARKAMPRDFRAIDTTCARVILVEGAGRVLQNFPEQLSVAAEQQLARLGVEVLTGSSVQAIDRHGVDLGDRRLEAANVFWAAGVVASPIGAGLGAAVDRAGRVSVAPDLSVPGHPEIFVTGDLAHIEEDGAALPGVAQVAIQSGRHAAEMIRGDLAGDDRRAFRYRDLGNLATIGRSAAVADFGRVRLTGPVAWWIWVVVHVFQLTGFRNRLLVMIQWTWAYFTYQRGIRLITGGAGPRLERPRKRTARRASGAPGGQRNPERRRSPVGVR